MSEFRQLGLSDWLVKRLASLSIKKPSAIQKAVIPALLKERRNIFGCSQTGTGKTLAYVLPILERLVVDPRPYFALILAPTRELAHQIHDVITVLAGPKSKTANALVTSLLIIGGGNYGVENASEDVQGLWLGKPNIIVATPGRFLDQIINRNYLDVCGSKRSFKFEILVMDEGDQLITPGFCTQLKDLLNWIDCKEVGNKRRQTVVLSASLTPALEALKQVLAEKDESNQPIVIDLLPTIDSIKKELSTNPYLDQRYFLCPSNVKAAFLVEALLDLDFKQLIIFCGTKREAKLIHKILITLGFAGKDFNLNPVLLNSDLKQALRFAAIDKFKSLKSRILVTTDLASRGLDLPLVDLIINYNCPKSAISYVHRVGRTCRKPHLNSSISLPVPELMEETLPTKTTEETSSTSESNLDPEKFLTPRPTKSQHKYLGKAITLVSQYDIKLLKNIESFIGIRMEQEEAIDEEHCNEILKQVTYAVKDAEIAIEKEMNELAEVKGVDLESKQKKRKSEMNKQIGKVKK